MILNQYKISKDGKASDEALRATVPAIFAESPSDNVSSRYAFVNTKRIVEVLQEDGYEVAQARGGLKLSSRSHGLHEVRMRRVGQPVLLNEVHPEIVILNSHNGSSSATLQMGLYRLVCSNGLIVGAGMQQAFRVPHIGDPRDAIIKSALRLMETTPIIMETMQQWKSRRLSVPEVQEFSKRAIELRPPRKTVMPTNPAFHGHIAAATRTEDFEDNLWNVFNRVQERIVKGGAITESANGRLYRTRGLRAVKPLVELNKQLWDLASEFLPN